MIVSQSAFSIVAGSILDKDHPYKFLVGLSIDGEPCSGSYIGNNQILTAYHCFYIGDTPLKKLSWQIIVPTEDVTLKLKADDYKFIKSEYTEFHYLGGLGGRRSIPFNDTVILSIDRSAHNLDDYFKPIKIGAPVDVDSKFLILGQGCYEYVYRSNDGKFRVGELSLSNIDEHFYSSTWSINDYPMMSGVCNGDSGGPMVAEQGKELIQIGVASYASIYQYEDYGPVSFSESHYVKLNPKDFD